MEWLELILRVVENHNQHKQFHLIVSQTER